MIRLCIFHHKQSFILDCNNRVAQVVLVYLEIELSKYIISDFMHFDEIQLHFYLDHE